MHVVPVTRRRPVGLLALATAPLLWVAPAASAQTIAIAEVGTWTRNPLASPPPEGGIAVANAPDGPLTVSAIRFDIGDAAGAGATLLLQEADAEQPVPVPPPEQPVPVPPPGQVLPVPPPVQPDPSAPAGAAIMACATTESWEAAANGDLADAPAARCDLGSVALEATSDGSWTADVTKLLAAGDSIVLVPATGDPSPYSKTFEPPGVLSDAAPAATGGSTDLAGSDPIAAGAPTAAPTPLGGVAPPAPFSLRPSELALPPVSPRADDPATAPASPVVGPDAAPLDTSFDLSGAPGRARDLGQALRIALLSLACGIASIPIFRLKDGRRVAGLSTLVDLVGRGNPASKADPT